jgi:MFS family permease
MRKRIRQWLNSEFAFLQGNILVEVLCSIFTVFSESIVNPFRSLFIRELGATPTVLGLMDSTGRAIHATIRLPGGHIADKYGRKRIIYLMTFGMSLSFLLYALAPSWEFILIGIIIANISALYYPAIGALVTDSIPPDTRGKGYATTQTIPKILAVASPAIAGILIDRMGLLDGMRIGYTIATFAFVIVAFLRLFFLEETLENPHDFDINELKNDIVTSITSIRGTWSIIPRNLKGFIYNMSISGFAGPFFYTVSAFYVIDIIGLSSVEWGLIGTAGLAILILIGFPAGKIVDRIGRVKSIRLVYLMWFPFLLWFIFARDFPTLFVIFAVRSLIGTLYDPAFMALRGDLIPRELRGRVIALIGMILSLVSIPSSAIAGVLYQWNPVSPFFANLCFQIFALVVLIYYVKEPQKREV